VYVPPLDFRNGDGQKPTTRYCYFNALFCDDGRSKRRLLLIDWFRVREFIEPSAAGTLHTAGTS
jgi:hypothetical protein